MQPDISKLENFLEFAHSLADTSGDILRKSFEKPISMEQKADSSPVTQIDKAVEVSIIKLIKDEYPDFGIVGEEFGNINETAKYKWVIDPIDGTKSFIAGYPLFTTLIALLDGGKPVLGIIDQPILQKRFSAISGQNIKPNNNSKKLNEAVVATTSTHHFSYSEAQKFEVLRKSCATTILGGDAYAYAMLTTGRIDIVVDAGMKPYDFCALAPIIEASGGVITDWNGNPLSLNSDGTVVACASKELHAAVTELLHQ